MPEFLPSSYDEIPYASGPISASHPDNLAAVATLFGMTPPAVDDCRVLELGCASGGNLIPMAFGLPGGRFLGIDLSARQVADGRKRVEALGLRNIELRAMSILDLDGDLGPFDYIICHGVYSWVPEPVREKILDVCRACLAERGIAYVSYNTYPGWHARGLIREMMGFHVRRFAEPRVRMREARAFLDFLVRAVPSAEGYYTRLLRQEAEILGPSGDYYVFHEHLEEVNQPVYLHQFAERAAAHGLQLVGEAKSSAMAANLPAEVRAAIDGFSPDPIEREQYLDFVCNRTFRRSLLCRGSVVLDRDPTAEVMSAFRVTAVARPLSADPDLAAGVVVEFRTPDEVSMSTDRPLVKAALCGLVEAWPRALSLDELWAWIVARTGAPASGRAPDGDGRRTLADILLHCARLNLVELHVRPADFAIEAGERPVASPLARLQAAADEPITNLRHRQVDLDGFHRILMRHLDGRRDRPALVDTLAAEVAGGVLELQRDDRPLEDPGAVRAALEESLEPALRLLARHALLVG